jgi:acyl-CoA thioester hydrolase
MTDPGPALATAGGGLVGGITVPYRVRFDECGPDGLVRSASLLRYAQDIAWIHSDALGFTRDWYDAKGLAWVVRAAELAVQAPIRSGQTVLVSTAVVGFRRVWSRRRTVARFEDGTPAFWGHTDFVMLDTVRGMPGRVPDELPARFAVPPGTFEPGRVSLADTPGDAVVLRSQVQARDIDPMGHVNNTVYLDYLDDAVRAAGGAGADVLAAVPRRVRLEYIVAAGPGERLAGAVWPLDRDAGWAWRLADGDGGELARGLVMAGDPAG